MTRSRSRSAANLIHRAATLQAVGLVQLGVGDVEGGRKRTQFEYNPP